MIVYKYINSKGGVDTLQNFRIKMNSPRNFNDPFELLPVIEDVTPEQVETAALNNDTYLRRLHMVALAEGKINKPYEQFKRETLHPERSKALSKTIAENTAKSLRATAEKNRVDGDKIALMSCFCGDSIDSQHEILMWAHYAEGYKGMRIAFDSDLLHSLATPLSKVVYSPDRLRLNPINYWEQGVQYLNDLYRRTLSAKSDAWAYENEYRWFVPTPACQKDGECYYFRINPKAIVGVDCGVRSSEERTSFIKNLVRKNLGESVAVRKTEIDDYEFKLKYIDCA